MTCHHCAPRQAANPIRRDYNVSLKPVPLSLSTVLKFDPRRANSFSHERVFVVDGVKVDFSDVRRGVHVDANPLGVVEEF